MRKVSLFVLSLAACSSLSFVGCSAQDVGDPEHMVTSAITSNTSLAENPTTEESIKLTLATESTTREAKEPTLVILSNDPDDIPPEPICDDYICTSSTERVESAETPPPAYEEEPRPSLIFPVENDDPIPALLDPAIPSWEDENYEYMTAEEFANILIAAAGSFDEAAFNHEPFIAAGHIAMNLLAPVNGAPVCVHYIDVLNDRPEGKYTLSNVEAIEVSSNGYVANMATFRNTHTGQWFNVTTTPTGIHVETPGSECSLEFAPCGTYDITELYTCESIAESEIGPAICLYRSYMSYDMRILILAQAYWSTDLCVAVK